VKILLIGAGGHARNVREMLAAAEHALIGYVDPNTHSWIDRPHWRRESETDSLPEDIGVALGIGGVKPEELKRRLELLQRFRDRGRSAPALVHPLAIVSKSAVIGEGAQIMAGTVLQANCRIGQGAIVNTGAIIEHDAAIADGVHVAPGAIVLGAVDIGVCSMIGAGSVILPGATVPKYTLVKASTRFPE
jgi:sugar O-acyltransferase (sialic acid O-acetyltransferase NeuD family)